jgi:hypothetical protein
MERWEDGTLITQIVMIFTDNICVYHNNLRTGRQAGLRSFVLS